MLLIIILCEEFNQKPHVGLNIYIYIHTHHMEYKASIDKFNKIDQCPRKFHPNKM